MYNKMRERGFCRALWLLFRGPDQERIKRNSRSRTVWMSKLREKHAFRCSFSSPRTINLTYVRFTRSSSKAPLPGHLPRKPLPVEHSIIYCSSQLPTTPLPQTLVLLLFSQDWHGVPGCLLYMRAESMLPHLLLHAPDAGGYWQWNQKLHALLPLHFHFVFSLLPYTK